MPFLVPFVFGAEWARAGIIMLWLTLAFVMQLVASPVSMVLHVTGNVALAMWLQLGGAVVRTGAVLLTLELAPNLATEVFATATALFYAAYVTIILRHLREGET